MLTQEGKRQLVQVLLLILVLGIGLDKGQFLQKNWVECLVEINQIVNRQILF